MAPPTYTQLVLAERPTAYITPSTFRAERAQLGALCDGEALIKVEYLSMEPAMRGWLDDVPSYLPPVQIGQVMRAAGIGRVVEVNDKSTRQVGDVVSGMFGWREYAIVDDREESAAKLTVPPGIKPLDFLGVLGSSGLTAYFGLMDIGKPTQGCTLLVSGAAGAVGSAACQLGKHLFGARVIALAGSPAKCEYLTRELGVDVALNYKSKDFRKELKDAIGKDGVEVYFDNVGGEVLDFVLSKLKIGARVVVCGAISEYNGPAKGLVNYRNLIIKRAKMEGFIVLDYKDRWPAAQAHMARLIAEGTLKRQYTVVEGVERAPDALAMLFSGGNTGKTVVKVSKETEQAETEQAKL